MKYIDQLIERYPSLSVCKKDIEDAAIAMIESFKKGGKLLVAGNGGSCADSDHITGELLKSFCKKNALPHQTLSTRLKQLMLIQVLTLQTNFRALFQLSPLQTIQPL